MSKTIGEGAVADRLHVDPTPPPDVESMEPVRSESSLDHRIHSFDGVESFIDRFMGMDEVELQRKEAAIVEMGASPLEHREMRDNGFIYFMSDL